MFRSASFRSRAITASSRRRRINTKVVDLDSFNGTLINGVPVKEQALAHGDHIAVGDVLLLFLAREDELPGDSNVISVKEEDSAARFDLPPSEEGCTVPVPGKSAGGAPGIGFDRPPSQYAPLSLWLGQINDQAGDNTGQPHSRQAGLA